MKTMQQWFDDYGVSHQNATNKAIHWLCVPSIFFSIVGLLSLVPLPFGNFSAGVEPYAHIGSLVILIGLLFYLRISFPIFLGMAIFSAGVLWLAATVNAIFPENAWLVYLTIFVVAWIGQFIGHKIEGQKPSFFKDIQFLMIGPAWLLGFVYRRLGVRY